MTYLALKALFAEPPDEVLAVAAERRLFEESGQEFMTLHSEHILLFERSLPSPDYSFTDFNDSVICVGIGVQ